MVAAAKLQSWTKALLRRNLEKQIPSLLTVIFPIGQKNALIKVASLSREPEGGR